MLRVEIGGGPSPAHPEFQQFDAMDWQYRTGLLYIVGDMRCLPYVNDSVDEIFASNVLEHVSFLETNKTLVEWQRVLKPGGQITIVVPDLVGIFEDYLNGVNSFQDFQERIYGSQTYDLDLHRAGFTRDMMGRVLESAGFQVLSIESSHAGGGITSICTKVV